MELKAQFKQCGQHLKTNLQQSLLMSTHPQLNQIKPTQSLVVQENLTQEHNMRMIFHLIKNSQWFGLGLNRHKLQITKETEVHL